MCQFYGFKFAWVWNGFRRIASLRLTYYDTSFASFYLFDMYVYGFLGQKLFYQLWPFHQAEVATIGIVLEAEVQYFGGAFDTIKVKMIDASHCGGIFIDDGKGGTTHGIRHTQFFAYGLDEGGLACSHMAIEGKNTTIANECNKFACRTLDVLQRVNDDFAHIILSWRKKRVVPQWKVSRTTG